MIIICELIDSVYLQQNSFDPVDATVTPDRQRLTFKVLYDICVSGYNFDDKKEARLFFNQLRQLFLDWNGTPENTDEFDKKENALLSHFDSKRRK